MKTILIGNLFNLLASIEAAKGRRKLAEQEEKNAIAQFTAVASGEDTVFVSTTEQKLASVKFQTRGTVNVNKLLELGVSPSVIQQATVQCAPFAVFRSH